MHKYIPSYVYVPVCAGRSASTVPSALLAFFFKSFPIVSNFFYANQNKFCMGA